MRLSLIFSLMLNLLPVSIVAAAPQRETSAGIVIEAEAFDQKTPDSRDFATTTPERGASAGAVLTRFFVKGSCVYRFTVPRAGDYTFWLRYAANNEVKIRAALDAKGAKGFQTATLAKTGGLGGAGAYRWGRLLRAPLAAGAHTLTLQSAPLRPDCLLLGTAPQPPAEGIPPQPTPKPVDEKLRVLLDKPVEPIRPDWLAGAADYQLPAWYDQWRVCAHTRLSPSWRDKPLFLTVGHELASLGFHVFCRHIKSGGEGAWWPAREGAVVDWARDRNVAREIIGEAHAAGLRLIAYNRHMEDDAMAARHPDWVCVDAAGKPQRTQRGAIMCMNSPYADYFLRRQLELAGLGVDGFYYDEIHMPKTGCWCPYCRKKFKAETGLDLPARPDPGDPVWNKLIDFNNATIERTFLKWRQALHARNPQLVMLIGSHWYPQMTERHLTQRLFRIADSMKTEFSVPIRGEFTGGVADAPISDDGLRPREPDVRLALGYTLSRDAADGRPAHIWVHGLLDARSAVFATAGIIAHGSIANLDNPEAGIPDVKLFKPAVELGNRVSPAFAGTTPLRWAAIHYAEAARDRYLPDETATWKAILYPMFGAYQALLRAHLPVGIITDSQLEEGRLEGYKVLFLPAPDALTAPMRAAVEAFRQRGGLVIEQRPQWQWHEAAGHEAATAAFLQAIAPAVARAPVVVTGGPEKLQSVSFVGKKENRLTVALVNDFSWVHTGRVPAANAVKKAGKKAAVKTSTARDATAGSSAAANRVPPSRAGVKVILRGQGTPRRVTELTTGRALAWKENGSAVEIALPEFEALVVLDVEFP